VSLAKRHDQALAVSVLTCRRKLKLSLTLIFQKRSLPKLTTQRSLGLKRESNRYAKF